MQKLTTSWTDKEGMNHEVCTPRGVGESVDDWMARHNEAVEALKAIFPPVN